MAECQKSAGMVMVWAVLCGRDVLPSCFFDKGFSIKKTHSATKYAYEKNAPKGTPPPPPPVEGFSRQSLKN